MQLKFGIDFDNTIVCYDALAHNLAVEKSLIDLNVPKNKEAVRNTLRIKGLEDLWTELQAELYGPRIKDAKSFPGLFEFLNQAKSSKLELFIVSHKTKYPYRGPQYDLHMHAWKWLDDQNIPNNLISRKNIFFEVSKQAKFERIASIGCDYFIDDLPEFLLDQNFPPKTERILFDPHSSSAALTIKVAHNWNQVISLIK